VHELAKELGVTSKQVLSKLQDMGEYVKSPSSTVEAPVARKLRESMAGGANGAAKPTSRGGRRPSAAPAPAAPAAAAPSRTGARAGAPLGPASAIPVGGGVIYEKAKVVVTQPTAGVYKGFDATCTHQKCLLADVQGGTINCACHGAKYSITDGSVVKPPATEPLPPRKVTVAGGNVSLT